MISRNSRLFGISLTKRTTRRWVVGALWLAVLPVASYIYQRYAFQVGHRNNFVIQMSYQGPYFLALLLGGVSSSGWIKSYRTIKDDHGGLQTLLAEEPTEQQLVAQECALDEREAQRRDRVHFKSYYVVQAITLLLFGLYSLLGEDDHHNLQTYGPLFFFLICMMFSLLPQSIITTGKTPGSAGETAKV